MARRRLLLLLVLPLGGLLAVPGSSASFNAQTRNPGSKYAFTALYAPSGLTAAASGHNVQLAWTAGQNGNGYSVLGVANGASSDCSSASFSSVGSTASTSYTDSGRFTPQGTWFCYQAKTTRASWTSVQNNPTAAAQLGFVVTGIQATNGGSPGVLDQGDTIVVTFNQAVDTSNGAPAGSVCAANAPDAIVIGTAVAAGTCKTNEVTTVGILSGGTLDNGGRYAATWAWSNGNRTLTVTVGNHTAGSFAGAPARGR